ncbi:DUF6401 family natural product biosynthesis protein [Qaidamihabitans albus]|uniref:DUF6401 family natural product biosynthesis protein n=1 Tax=Qaidamihabitans albus TaxID=2795733 RepID=UPI0018F249CA|nr:DUF6401 family natural product biosynthesis protein [Qaidamihabitans albus]
MSRWLNVWHESAARRELASLADRLGHAGLRLGSLAPGLLAAVDQHAASVRDILTLSGGRVSAAELAGYARGVQDVAAESGWRLPGHASWTPDWVSLRLIAVCLLAVAAPVVVAGGDADPLLFF